MRNLFFGLLIGLFVGGIGVFVYNPPLVENDTGDILGLSLSPSGSTTTEPGGEDAVAVTSQQPSITPPAPRSTSVLVSSKRLTTITYTNSGFEPETVEVRRGTDIRFLNMSSKSMKVRTYAYYDRNIPIPGYSQETSVGKGKEFVFSVTATGTYPYYNLNNQGDFGVFFVR